MILTFQGFLEIITMSKDFYSTVYEMNNHALLRTSVYHELVYYGTERVNSFLLDIVKNNR